jgi:hypothetical protein
MSTPAELSNMTLISCAHSQASVNTLSMRLFGAGLLTQRDSYEMGCGIAAHVTGLQMSKSSAF